jgi:hypothetical protein
MEWTTLYITGKSDFSNEVRRRLEHARIKYMTGYMGTGNGKHDMYWIDETEDLRKVKTAIGGKIIWKHRLRFYTNLESFIEARNTRNSMDFSDEELDLIHSMQAAH